MAKLILHIGMVKTGSSAIQASLRAADRPDFIYPPLGGVTFKRDGEGPTKRHHTDALVNLFSSNPERFAKKRTSFGKKVHASAADEESIRKAAAEAGTGSVILSSEALYSYLREDDVVKFREFADALFDDVKVVAYIREPYSLISASFWTQVKGSRLATFKASYRRYRQFLKFDRAFGRERVVLWPYDRSSFPNGDVVQHFSSQLGLSPIASRKSKNVTLSRPGVSAIYRLNRLLMTDVEQSEAHRAARLAIGSGFPHENWPKFRLSPDVIAPLIEANASDIDWIEKRLGRTMSARPEKQDTDVASESELLEIDPDAKVILHRIAGTLPKDARSFLRRALDA